MRRQAEAAGAAATGGSAAPSLSSQESSGLSSVQSPSGATAGTPSAQQPIDGVRLRAQTPTPTGTPPIGPTSQAAEPYIIIGADAQPLNLQHSAIARKFYGKQPPRVTVED